MNNAYDVNQALQNLIAMKNSGKSPKMVLQMVMQQNPKVGQLMTQFRNMSNGRNPRDFITQLARQNGVSDKNISDIQQMFTK